MFVRDRVARMLVLPALIAMAAALMMSVAVSQPVDAGGNWGGCRQVSGTALKDLLRYSGSRVQDGTATLVVPRDICPVTVSFSSYELPGGYIRPFDEQILHDNVTGTYGPGRHTINVTLPDCSHQTDLYVGDVIPQLDARYGHPSTKLVAYDYTQGTPCDQGTPDVTITKAASATDVVAGDAFTYTLVVTNGGTGTAQAVTVTDNSLDPPLLLSAPSATQGSCTAAANNLACNLGDIAAGGTVTITFTATTTVETCPRARNQASVAAANEPVEAQANNLSEIVNVVVSCDGPPDVTIAKSASATDVLAGDAFTYTLVVTNGGTGTAQAVTVADNTLDPPLILSAPSATQGSCTAVANNLACNLDDILRGGTVTITFTATTTVETCPRARNQASVAAANEPVEAQANNLSELVVVLVSCEPPEVPEASLNVKKVDPNGKPLAGAVFTVQGLNGTYTTGADGKFCIVGLADDTVWLVTEIKAPAGYVIGDQPSQMVEVDDDGDCDSPSATFVNKPKQAQHDPCKDPHKPWWKWWWCHCRDGGNNGHNTWAMLSRW